ncbi:hypothetical protein Ddye_015854 [Dipteronia dyeriana]|uniref:Uncharacterized protein n=1 Tax=Dipteronia dyeriana TaxID=168575 RepID=A0AAD9U5L3_9ROSI|nr:hypothetical protein Ddye_015854 [Dipteronia dyeriana]
MGLETLRDVDITVGSTIESWLLILGKPALLEELGLSILGSLLGGFIPFESPTDPDTGLSAYISLTCEIPRPIEIRVPCVSFVSASFGTTSNLTETEFPEARDPCL